METKTVYVVVEMMGAIQRDVGTFDTREEARACLKAKGLEHLMLAQREQRKFGGDAQKQERYAAALLEKGLAGDLLDVGTAQFAIEERHKRVAVSEPKLFFFVARTEPQDETICLLLRRLAAKNFPKSVASTRCIGLHQLGAFLMQCANDLHFPKRNGEAIDLDEDADSALGDEYSLTVLYPGKVVTDKGDFSICAGLGRDSRFIRVVPRDRGLLDIRNYRDVDCDGMISMFREFHHSGLQLSD